MLFLNIPRFWPPRKATLEIKLVFPQNTGMHPSNGLKLPPPDFAPESVGAAV